MCSGIASPPGTASLTIRLQQPRRLAGVSLGGQAPIRRKRLKLMLPPRWRGHGVLAPGCVSVVKEPDVPGRALKPKVRRNGPPHRHGRIPIVTRPLIRDQRRCTGDMSFGSAELGRPDDIQRQVAAGITPQELSFRFADPAKTDPSRRRSEEHCAHLSAVRIELCAKRLCSSIQHFVLARLTSAASSEAEACHGQTHQGTCAHSRSLSSGSEEIREHGRDPCQDRYSEE